MIGASLVAVVVGLVATGVLGGGGDEMNGTDPGGGKGSQRAGESRAKTDRPRSNGRRDARDPSSHPERPVMTVVYEESHYTEMQMRSRELIGMALQDGNANQRAEAMNQIRAALGGTDEVEVFAALEALLALKETNLDRSGLRELVELHLEAPDALMRRSAWYALAQTEIHPEDIERVLALAEDPDESLRRSSAHLITLFEKGDLTGTSGLAVLGLLAADDLDFRREVLRGIWGASLSPALEARVIELSQSEHRQDRHDTVYFALSTQENKSAATVGRLIEVLGDKDVVNIASRAAWGLQQGVPEELTPIVLEAALNLVEGSESPQLQVMGIELLGKYATGRERAEIARLAQDPNLEMRTRLSLERLLQGME